MQMGWSLGESRTPAIVDAGNSPPQLYVTRLVDTAAVDLFDRYCWQRLLKQYDPAGDGQVSFDDFVRYVTEHEKALRLSFESLDHKRDGKLSGNLSLSVSTLYCT